MAAANSGEEIEILHTGCTIAQLATVFDCTQREIKEKIVGKVQPSTPLHKAPVRYRLRDVAPLLCKVEMDVESALKSITPSKLPPMLQDAFWKAQRSKLAYMEEVGQLWSSERVIEAFAEALKPLRMNILMFQQRVSDEVGLTEPQRSLIVKISDKMLADLSQSLEEKFKDWKPNADEHVPPLSEAEILTAMETKEVEEDEEDDDWLS